MVQVLLAGLAIPQLGGTGSFITHVDVGRIVGILFLALVVTAVLAGAGRRRICQAAGLLGLFVVQMFLPYMDDGARAADRGGTAPGQRARDVRLGGLVRPGRVARAGRRGDRLSPSSEGGIARWT